MNYQIDAIQVLLNEDCLLKRYHPLLPYKEQLLKNLLQNRCLTKTDCMKLSDEALIASGLPDRETACLFRCFLVLYDPKESKFKEIEKCAADEAEAASFRELYLLPGVKATRAKLYYDAGYRHLSQIASATPEQLIRDTSDIIRQKGLAWKAPLPKEVRTHIAVAKAFTVYAIK